ncbi:hypothetical protein DERF_006621 [Dermatophagoides farinae]|uniref:Uncharacterized protein n=1 Tax=Dermatophagoides farinae TaxID=6954 RepID=A0A922L756_DERFA|nr:hypothetical protein DERF_006621 [Dermatophagoides farinae]
MFSFQFTLCQLTDRRIFTVKFVGNSHNSFYIYTIMMIMIATTVSIHCHMYILFLIGSPLPILYHSNLT